MEGIFWLCILLLARLGCCGVEKVKWEEGQIREVANEDVLRTGFYVAILDAIERLKQDEYKIHEGLTLATAMPSRITVRIAYCPHCEKLCFECWDSEVVEGTKLPAGHSDVDRISKQEMRARCSHMLAVIVMRLMKKNISLLIEERSGGASHCSAGHALLVHALHTTEALPSFISARFRDIQGHFELEDEGRIVMKQMKESCRYILSVIVRRYKKRNRITCIDHEHRGDCLVVLCILQLDLLCLLHKTVDFWASNTSPLTFTYL